MLGRIIEQGYVAYAQVALQERRAAGLPPFAAMAIVRADSHDPARPMEFLAAVRTALLANAGADAEISYPIPALMERRGGRYRALIVLTSNRRAAIGQVLREQMNAIEALARGVRVRWSSFAGRVTGGSFGGGCHGMFQPQSVA